MYSARRLTFDKDRLPAVSGIAKLMGIPSESYFAGLWKEKFAQELCWRSSRGTSIGSVEAWVDRFESSETYVAPSWSWASAPSWGLGAGFQFIDFWVSSENNTSCNVRMELNSFTASTKLKGLNPFGEIIAEYLEVSAKVMPLPPSKVGRSRFLDRELHLALLDGEDFAELSEDWSGGDEIRRSLSMVLIGSFSRDCQLVPAGYYRVGCGILIYRSRVPGKYIRVGAFKTLPGAIQYFDALQYQTFTII